MATIVKNFIVAGANDDDDEPMYHPTLESAVNSASKLASRRNSAYGVYEMVAAFGPTQPLVEKLQVLDRGDLPQDHQEDKIRLSRR